MPTRAKKPRKAMPTELRDKQAEHARAPGTRLEEGFRMLDCVEPYMDEWERKDIIEAEQEGDE